MISDENLNKLLEEFKGRMLISHSSRDPDLKDMILKSVNYVKRKCGEFDVDGDKETDVAAVELTLERTRYAYNEALEYFEDNFLSDILSLGIEMVGASDEEE